MESPFRPRDLAALIQQFYKEMREIEGDKYDESSFNLMDFAEWLEASDTKVNP